MDFVNLGAHCGIKHCNQIDYLPFECEHCQIKFCLEHKDPHSHECKKYVVKERRVHPCPECNTLLVVGKDDDLDLVIVRHLDKECGKKINKGPKSYPCTFKGCKAKEFVSVVCDHCKDNFCFKHRFPTSHKCTKQEKHSNTTTPTSLFKNTTKPNTTSTTTRTNTNNNYSNNNTNNYLTSQKQQQDELRAIRARQNDQYKESLCEINVLMTNGEIISQKFNGNDSLSQVQSFINSKRNERTPYAIITESNPTPFSQFDLDLSLKELNLFPSATLVLVNLASTNKNNKDDDLHDMRSPNSNDSNFSILNPFTWFK